jgi:hypothetical protein
MKPEMLWEARPKEYGEFTLDTFRDNIHQELRSRRERAYWLNRKKKKQKRARGEEDNIGDMDFGDGDDGWVPLDTKNTPSWK